jgi:hypothetical protein
MLTSLGIGEAAITVLNEKGVPTPLAATLLRAPQSRMDILNDNEIDDVFHSSKLVNKYNETIDRESAYEMLTEKLKVSQELEEKSTRRGKKTKRTTRRTRQEKSTMEKVLTSTTTKQIGRTLAREFMRGILGVLGLGGTTRRKR